MNGMLKNAYRNIEHNRKFEDNNTSGEMISGRVRLLQIHPATRWEMFLLAKLQFGKSSPGFKHRNEYSEQAVWLDLCGLQRRSLWPEGWIYRIMRHIPSCQLSLFLLS